MSESISFRVEGTPKPWRRPRLNRRTGAIWTDAQDAAWRSSILGQALAHRPPAPWTGPIAMCLYFEMPIPRSWAAWKREAARGMPCERTPDIDNLTKAVLDALEDVFFENDKQVCELDVTRQWAQDAPGVDIWMDKLLALPRTKKALATKGSADSADSTDERKGG